MRGMAELEKITIGDRVRHPKMSEWGVGQVVSVALPKIDVFFEGAGEKTLRTDLVSLRFVQGPEAESEVLDNKFSGKRHSRRAFRGPQYFNDGKSASRKQFIQSLGGTCANWNWSWSFVNHEERKIFIGAWQDHIQNDRALILSSAWRTRRGREQNGYGEALDNLKLVEREDYSLHVYTMIMDPASEPEFEQGTRKIGAILNDTAEARLAKEGDEWYAILRI